MSFDPWHLQTFLGIILCAWLISIRGYITIYQCIWAYFFIYSVGMVFFIPIGVISQLKLALMYNAAKWALILLMLPLAIETISERTVRAINFVILSILFVDSVWLSVGGAGIFMGTTHDGAILAIFLPHLFNAKHKRLPFLAIPFILAILITKSTAGVIIMCAEALVFAAYYIRQRWLAAAISLMWAVFLGVKLFTDVELRGKRWEHWVKYINFWEANANPLFGFGPGSTEWLSYAYKLHDPPQAWLHGDWLQIAFETGVVGLMLALVFWSCAMYSFRKSWAHVASWLGLAIGMLVYSPIQFFLVQWLIGSMLRKEK